MLRAFHFNLAALSYVALLVGLFLVYNTVAVSVIARREEIGVLRAVGASRGTVLRLFLAEAAALGGGWRRARGPRGMAARAGRRSPDVDHREHAVHCGCRDRVPALDPRDALLAIAMGIGLALLVGRRTGARSEQGHAARGAARRRSARGALPGQPAATGARRPHSCLAPPGPARGWGRSADCRSSASPRQSPPSSASRSWCPRRSRCSPATGQGRSPALFGVEGQLAHANLSGAIPRLAVSIAALAVSLSMMVAIAIMIGSFRETVIYWVGQTLQADLYMSTARRSSLDTQSSISQELETAVASHPAVAAVDRFRTLNLLYDGRLTVLGTGDFGVLLAHGNLVFKEPADGRAALREAIGKDAVVVLGVVRAQGGQARGRHRPAADAARARRLPSRRGVLRLLDRPRRRGDGSRRRSRATSASSARRA